MTFFLYIFTYALTAYIAVTSTCIANWFIMSLRALYNHMTYFDRPFSRWFDGCACALGAENREIWTFFHLDPNHPFLAMITQPLLNIATHFPMLNNVVEQAINIDLPSQAIFSGLYIAWMMYRVFNGGFLRSIQDFYEYITDEEIILVFIFFIN